MNIDQIVIESGKSKRTVQRWIAAFNTKNNTNHENGESAKIVDPGLLAYLQGKFETKTPLPTNQLPKPKKQPKKQKEKVVQSSSLQKRLSSDGLAITVIVIILFADVFAFASVGDHEFGKNVKFAWLLFGLMGVATGIGSVITYLRIESEKLALSWKIVFGILQYIVLSMVMSENWTIAERAMNIMFVLVFIGVQKSIKQ